MIAAMITRFGLLLVIFLFVLLPIRAEQNLAPSSPVPYSEKTASFDPAAATQAWLDTVPVDKRAKSDAYFEGGYWLILWNFLLVAGISIFLLSSRISARLRDWAARTTNSRNLQVVLYAIPYSLIVALLSFPLLVYQQFFREHQYGLATQTFGPWFGEQLIAFVVNLIAGIVVLIGLYAVFRRASRSWWLWGTILIIVYAFIGNFIAPIWVEPLFNTYKPLTDPTIRDPILAMAGANEIPVKQVFEVDASRQTTRVSANVSGLLGTTRIALNDNLVKQCSLPEIRMVMAHEMGHYVLNHGARLTIYFGIIALFGFAIARVVFDWAMRRWGDNFGLVGSADPAGFPLLVLIFVTYAFLLTPVLNSVVRVAEREADQFGINTAREPDGMAQVSLKLGTYRKLNPTPLEEFIFFDHPSGRSRIRMAMDWKGAHLPCGTTGTSAGQQ